ncbi:hypothetical protein D3C71_1076090 [compost metagenome]
MSKQQFMDLLDSVVVAAKLTEWIVEIQDDSDSRIYDFKIDDELELGFMISLIFDRDGFMVSVRAINFIKCVNIYGDEDTKYNEVMREVLTWI